MSDELAHNNDEAGYSRVSPQKAVQIARLKRDNPKLTQQEIAHVVGVHHSTVSRWLRELTDNTVNDARNLMKSQALPAAMKIVDHVNDPDPRVSLQAAKAIAALAGVQEGSQQVSVGVQVIVGSASQPAGPDPFTVFDATVVESKS